MSSSPTKQQQDLSPSTSPPPPPPSQGMKKSPSGSGSNKKMKNISSCGNSPTYHHQQQQQQQQRSEPPFHLYPALASSSPSVSNDIDRTTPSSSVVSSSSSSSPTLKQGWDSVVQLLRGRKRIAILTGAGMSVSCGIPDFRTKGSGLYSTLDTAALGLSYPEDLFDGHFFRDNPAPFYKFARRLYFPFGTTSDDGTTTKSSEAIRAKPSDSHKLLALLEQKKMLLRVYSQNIDGLEEDAGVSSKKICYAHGSLNWASCCKCKRKVNSKEIESNIINGTVPYCQAPVAAPAASLCSSSSSPPPMSTTMTTIIPREPSARVAAASTRKRSRAISSMQSGEEDEENNYSNHTIGKNGETVCGGIMKPGITFFGEALHNTVKSKLESDRDKVDALIVIGTSLSVAPISKVIDYLPKNIPRILINRTIVHPPEPGDDDDTNEQQQQKRHDFRKNYVFDAYLLGYCDVVTRALGHDLFNTDTKQSHTNVDLDDAELLSSLLKPGSQNTNSPYNADDWSSVHVPSERVFLFQGAQPPQPGTNSVNKNCIHNSADGDLSFREIAKCDGCTKRIEGTIQKCMICFDYDLCEKCFPILSKTHYDGKHHFTPETVPSE